jgi:DNA polymerase III epsilon subunit family exonuclease
MFVSLDLETTGITPETDKIIEFGAVKFDLNGEAERKSFLINPGIKLPDLITHITNIKDDDLKDAPKITEKISEIEEFIKDCPIVGHNIQFDLNFLVNNGVKIPETSYDTFELSAILLPNLPSYSLEILSHELDLQHKDKHRALDDSIAAMELFTKLIKKIESLPTPLFQKVQTLSQKSNCPLKNLFSKLKNNPQESPPLPPQKTPPQTNTDQAQAIIETQENSFFETTPPYEALIKDLLSKIENNDYLAIPKYLFDKIVNELPAEINKIDIPENYLDPKKLRDFEKQEFFEDFELKAVLKYLIWENQTQSKLLKEVALFGEERSTLKRICAVKHQDPPKSSPTICTHQYLIQAQPQAKNLYLINYDSFAKTVFYENAENIKIDLLLSPLNELKRIKPEAQTIDSLISKCTILFGLIGVFFEKNNDQNPYGARAEIRPSTLENKEWQEMNALINNLIEISHELAEIKDDQTLPHLQDWKNQLNILKKTFENPDLENNILIIEINYYEDTVVQMTPININEKITKSLSPYENFKIIDESFEVKFGLNLPIKKITTTPESLELTISEDQADPLLLIKEVLKNSDKIAFIFNSKKQLEKTTLILSKNLNDPELDLVSQTTGSANKVAEKFQQSKAKKTLLLTTTSAWINFPYTDQIQTLIIDKIPFDAPSNIFLYTISKNYQNAFTELQIPLAITSFRKILNKLKFPSPKVFILDDRLAKKDYNRPILDLLNQLTPVKIAKLSNLQDALI